jgi:diaminopimelate epimerase
MKFTKMHGIGNDYIYVNCMQEEPGNPAEISKRISHRRTGVGSDGLVLILPSEAADFKMRMFNADGSESEMCGNAIRCLAKYVYDRGITDKENIEVETLAGILSIVMQIEDGKVELVRVDMGEPRLAGREIPVAIDKDQIIDELLKVDGHEFRITCASPGNPHCVIFVDEITDNLVREIGPKIEIHPLFPEKTNVEFVKVQSRKEVDMRVWERGSGETWACGTGASAVCVATVLNGLTDRKITVHLRGGDLEIEWADDNHIFMTGPAAFVCDFEWIL